MGRGPDGLVAEFIVRLSLVLRGCGRTALAASFPSVGIGLPAKPGPESWAHHSPSLPPMRSDEKAQEQGEREGHEDFTPVEQRRHHD